MDSCHLPPSLRGSLNKDYAMIRPDGLFNLPEHNNLADRLHSIFTNIVNEKENCSHTAGGVPFPVPAYYSIFGGARKIKKAKRSNYLSKSTINKRIESVLKALKHRTKNRILNKKQSLRVKEEKKIEALERKYGIKIPRLSEKEFLKRLKLIPKAKQEALLEELQYEYETPEQREKRLRRIKRRTF